MGLSRSAALLSTTALLLLIAPGGCGDAGRQPLKLGVPTTLQDSGLIDVLLSGFESSRPEYHLMIVAAGSGELLALGARGDLDVLLSHSPDAEREFMEAGHGLLRRRVMQNDFVIVGPRSDPAGVRGMSDAAAALARIAEAEAPFFSRGDDSGTHRKELGLREAIGLPAGGAGYRELGQGMAAVLRASSDAGAYALADRATFLNLGETLDLKIMVEGDARLVNVYSVIVTARASEPDGARAFADWVSSEAGRRVIAAYGTERFGRSLYFPAVDRVSVEDPAG